MKLLLALLALLLVAAVPPPLKVGPLLRCAGQDERTCVPADPGALGLGMGETVIAKTVTVDGEALPLDRPLMVSLSALASAELRWNGGLVGRNGVPGPNRASERPGRYFAAFEVPPELVRPGKNLLTVRLSAHRLWLPVHYPLHELKVGLYETPVLPGRGHYLPAMLMIGAFAAALAYFAAAALLDRSARGAALLAGIAGAALAQLVAEASKAFVAYAYPWHLARITGIALLAALTAVLIAAYAAGRFAPEWRRPILVAIAAAAAAGLVFLPYFDAKAMAALLAGGIALAVAGARGLRCGRRGSSLAVAGGFAFVAGLVLMDSDFLDRGYYLLLALLLVGLVAEQVWHLRAARASAARAAILDERLRRAEAAGEPILQLKDGKRVHRAAQQDVLFAKGADDYSELKLRDGRTLLVTCNLASLQAELPDRFIRVHKSFVVNLDRVERSEPRPGGGRRLVLESGERIPVGRRYAAALII